MNELSLPVPPSANELHRVVRGRLIRSKAYRTWLAQASQLAALLAASKRIPTLAHCRVVIAAPVGYRRDLDNMAKPVLDALQKAGVLEDDRYVESVTVKRMAGSAPSDTVAVTIEPCAAYRACNACRRKTHGE